jgi:hypothetical protein
MKFRVLLSLAIVLLIFIFGIIWFTFSIRNPQPEQIFDATINRDCAPWDGSAFTMSIPMSNGARIDISIYQSPDIRLPVTFSFPDETIKVGNALYLPPVGSSEQLTGKVSFQHVEQGIPVEGELNLITDTGQQFKGEFIAEWENEIVYCG